jgi:uncharacterized protein with PQ loop repeat
MMLFSWLGKFFDNAAHRHPVDYVANLNSVLSGVALYPQLFSLVRGGTAEGLSVITFLIIAVNSLVWVMYAVHRHAPPLLISGACNFVAASGILLCIFYQV